MAETLSQMFIESLREPRDRLYALALATSSTPSEAEARLVRAVHAAFGDAAASGGAGEAAGRIQRILEETAPGLGDVLAADTTMPADVWARVTAAVQTEAAKSAHAEALHAESELLKPDPMLAPKKRRVRDEEEEEFELSTPRKVVLGIAAVVVAGGLITAYVMRTEPPAETQPATGPAAGTQAATMPTARVATMPETRSVGP
jgi:hypothetical protein